MQQDPTLYPEIQRYLTPGQLDGPATEAQSTTIISCPKKMVGRVIGKNGETIKALQNFTGAQIQIDQRIDPTRVSIAGPPKALITANNMVQDIVAGTFKGFAMLRAYANQGARSGPGYDQMNQQAPVYIKGYGFVPPSQFSDPSEAAALANFTDYSQTFQNFQGYPAAMPSPLMHPGMQGMQGMPMYDTQFAQNSALSNALVAQQLHQMNAGQGRLALPMAPGMQQVGVPQLTANAYGAMPQQQQIPYAGANGFSGLPQSGDPGDLAAQLGAMNLNSNHRPQAANRAQEGIPIPSGATMPAQQQPQHPTLDQSYQPGGSAPANFNF